MKITATVEWYQFCDHDYKNSITTQRQTLSRNHGWKSSLKGEMDWINYHLDKKLKAINAKFEEEKSSWQIPQK